MGAPWNQPTTDSRHLFSHRTSDTFCNKVIRDSKETETVPRRRDGSGDVSRLILVVDVKEIEVAAVGRSPVFVDQVQDVRDPSAVQFVVVA